MQQSALRSLAIVCDHLETTLFAIVCDLRFAIRDRLRSSAIIWKPALSLKILFYEINLINDDDDDLRIPHCFVLHFA